MILLHHSAFNSFKTLFCSRKPLIDIECNILNDLIYWNFDIIFTHFSKYAGPVVFQKLWHDIGFFGEIRIFHQIFLSVYTETKSQESCLLQTYDKLLLKILSLILYEMVIWKMILCTFGVIRVLFTARWYWYDIKKSIVMRNLFRQYFSKLSW